MDAPTAPTIGSPLLVPFDGSANAEAVFPFVPLLAHGGQEVILLQVVPEAHALRGPLGDIVLSADELREAVQSAARADLRRAAAALSAIAPNLRIEEVIESGDPAEGIAAVADRCHARTILLATQGVSATGPGSFGSVVGHVVRTAPVPVMVVPPTAAAPDADVIARFVVAHDGSERAARALPLARDVAARLSAPIHVVSVVEHEASPLPAGVAANIDPHLREEVQGDALNLARRHLEVAGANLLRQGLPASWQVLTGPVAPAIIEACAPRDVLIITSHGQSGERWMIGSVAERLVRESPVPVILLRTPPDHPADAAP
jgi:nucleotide-binding universal stress UspA family protein